ncbi:MAG: ANTAR domain-containing protein [Egibacteraceae bacterium]
MFAAQAAVALANTQTYAASVRLAAQLGEALDSRAVIEQAKGILMASRRCSEDEAFDPLRAASQAQQRKLRHLAQEVVTNALDGKNDLYLDESDAIHSGHAWTLGLYKRAYDTERRDGN